MTLGMVENGKTTRLVAIDAGCELKGRLSALGLIPGVEVKMIRNPLKGPVVISLWEGQLILGRGMAQKIIVR